MIDHQRPIEPPPSIDEILGNQGRIGRVDFSHRLAPVAVVEPDPAEVQARADAEAEARARAAAAELAPAPSVTDLLPDRAEQPSDIEQPSDAEQPSDSGQTGQPGDTEHPGRHGDADLTDESGDTSQSDTSQSDAGVPHEQDPDDDLEEVDSDELADLEPTRAVVYPADEPFEPEPLRLPRRQPTAQVTNLLSLVPAEDVQTVSDDIDDVVDGVIARIREAQHATMVHLEAIEAEAALRCEMLTAQAELDAELIRLHARREAHAIIAAARQRSGVSQPQQAEDQRRRLDQLGEAAMRLAEELEALGVDPDSPEHPFRR